MSIENERTLCPICGTDNRNDAKFCQQCGNNIVLNNRYRITRAIKEGGMGAVYAATDQSGKRYALKSLIDRFNDKAERDEAIERFKEEASILRELKHPQIPHVYGDFLHGGRYYLAMDFVEGDDLEDLQRQQPNEQFDEPTVLRWAEQIANVLDYLHERRLIYRDVKPSNIMIERKTGNVKVVDFGIAKLFQPNERGTLIGTPGYSPPEQYQGQATPQSDIYALGATLHHLLTGRDPRDEAPFSFPPVRDLAPKVSVATAQAISVALEMEISKRWKSAAAFRAALPLESLHKPKPKPKPQPTVILEQKPQKPAMAASVGSIPQPQKAAPTSSTKPKPKPKSQPLPSKPTTKPNAKPQKRFRPWIPLLTLMVVGALLALGIPGMDQKILNFFNTSPTASVTPIPQAASNRWIERNIVVSVAEGTPDAEIANQLKQQYRQAIVAEFSNTAKINEASLTFVGGNPRNIGTDASGIRYEVTIRASVAIPRP
ncbi:serine/threonine protein kinase [Herpetosiphon llansteffanensis]|uniref:serine/threonine protein kinase n=1 Tax=Herpetosiphon llansteffanensis TaxID=2094568 RepID=UPI000D7C85CF|nr:serine/threonine-protein kinase [Herpetosiphon llansteffanensis]